MEFFASNYTYINFLSAWAYLFLSLTFVVSQRSKINKISYTGFVVFAICQAIVKFIDTFLCGKDISLNNFAYITHTSFTYISYISLLIGSVSAYSKFARIKFLKYYTVLLIIISLSGYCFLGEVGSEALMFLCFFITSSVFVLLTEYHYYHLIYDDKIKLALMICFSIFFVLSMCFLELLHLLKIDTVAIFAIMQMVVACSLFVISNLIFKYFKVLREKKVKIYDYVPFYWKHIPLASILFLIFTSGFFFLNYLEITSKNEVIEVVDSITSDLIELSNITFKKIDQLSKTVSRSPSLKEYLYHPSPDLIPNIARMLNAYKDSFGVSLVCVLDMQMEIVFYSNYPDMDFSKKKNIYNENIKFFEHLNVWIKEGSIEDKSYISNGTFYYSSLIDSRRYGKVGIVFIKDSVLNIVKKLNEFENVFIINSHGEVLMSGEENARIRKLWDPSGSFGKKRSLFLAEVKDKDIISINNEQFYVSRKSLGREDWSILKLAPLGAINQSKSLGYLVTSALTIIVLLIFYSINQSNKILGLALLHQDILDSARSIIIISTDLHGKIVVYGKGSGEIIGYSIEDLNKVEFFETIFFNKNKEPITFNEAVSLGIKDGVEWLCRRKDGKYINILIYIAPQLSISGKIIGYIFSGVDITNTKNAELNFKEQFQFLQYLMDNIPLPVYYKDSDMRLIGCNRAFESLVSHSKGEIIGNSTEGLISDQKADLFEMKTDLQISKDMESISYELPVFFKDKGTLNLIFYKAAYKNLAGRFSGIIGVLLDVTKERQMQIEKERLQFKLIQQNKLASLGELAGSISHELNNPLSIIVGFSQVLSRNKSLDEETAKGIKNIYDAALRSQKIIRNMLEFSRTDILKFQKIDLNNVIESTLLIIEKDLIKDGVEVTKDFLNKSVLVQSNAMQMQQVILNILLNAKDAMPNGGKLTIKTKTVQDAYILSISDTGLGIEPQILCKIFDPFFTTKEIGKGTGLGLSICYGIVKNLKGEISVESVVGKGTTFYIKFPIAI
ncbi:MAG: PAS domain S-box protein [Endomicrobium sp.]|jgi:PAS domain S-box-containing protein|nr:PAS domain S-box protein [Endomicrobium sp.]